MIKREYKKIPVSMKRRPYLVYCDESGNSGANYLDREQPYFVLASWVVPASIAANTAFLEKYINQMQLVGEFKGSRILGSNRGRKVVCALVEELGQIGCVPVFTIAEKRYCIAGWIVETLLDPEENSLMDKKLYWIKRKELAETFYGISNNNLELFATAYVNADKNLMREAVNQISVELIEGKQNHLGKILLGSLETLDENVGTINRVYTSEPNNVWAAINASVFPRHLMMIEELGMRLQSTMAVVHDETKQFASLYKKVYLTLSGAERHVLIMTDGQYFITGFKYLKRFSLEKSAFNPWIQLADILASIINRCLVSSYHQRAIPIEIGKLGTLILPAMLVPNFTLGLWIGSNNSMDKLTQSMREWEKA